MRHVPSGDLIPQSDMSIHQEGFTVHFPEGDAFFFVECGGMRRNDRNIQMLASARLAVEIRVADRMGQDGELKTIAAESGE